MTPRRSRPDLVKLFCGIIAAGEDVVGRAEARLVEHFGPIDCVSPIVEFTFTDYYREEMGENLLRKWVSFTPLRARGYLAPAKHAAVAIEGELALGGGRRANLDPGYVDGAQVVLASGKNFSHRIYVGMGYYAEVTLIYEHGGFRSLAWTYPDYKTAEALAFLNKARSAYMRQRLGK
jgi:hypothetical protein